MSKDTKSQRKTIAQNRKARFDYHIAEHYEAGIMLVGSEVKSCRDGKASITESYATIENDEAWLINARIDEYPGANRFNHDPKRPRKLLMHRREIEKLAGHIQKKGATLVPIELYFNKFGKIKIDIGLATGKAQHDKRQTQKDRDWQRDKARLMREKG